MTAFVPVLALALLAPDNGATVSLLRPAQVDYLAQDRRTRFERLDDATYRHRLVSFGHTPQPIRLVWTNAPEAAVELIVEPLGEPALPRQSFALTNVESVAITNLELGRAYRWTIRSGDETATASFVTDPTPPRLLCIGGVVNARDLGGWRTKGGRKVRQGMLLRTSGFRGSASSRDKSIFSSRFTPGDRDITDAGIDYLRREIGVRTDLEVRGVMETVCMTASALGPDVRFVKEPFSAYNFIDNLIRGREPFARLFPLFSARENYPIVFHCAGGRDRTGTLSFLLLGLLGVSDEDLCRDWESSVFSEESTEFGSARIERLLGYLRGLGGATFAEDCEIFARSCGITDDDIAAFRKIMLEGEVTP